MAFHFLVIYEIHCFDYMCQTLNLLQFVCFLYFFKNYSTFYDKQKQKFFIKVKEGMYLPHKYRWTW